MTIIRAIDTISIQNWNSSQEKHNSRQDSAGLDVSVAVFDDYAKEGSDLVVGSSSSLSSFGTLVDVPWNPSRKKLCVIKKCMCYEWWL